MFCLINKELKIVFWWSAKCGCSYIKKLFYILSDFNIPYNIHHNSFNKFNINDNNYKHILFIRNPYKRIVSGFLDKYVKQKSRKWFNSISYNHTFLDFVDKLSHGLLNNMNEASKLSPQHV